MTSPRHIALMVLLPLLSWTAAAAEKPGITDKEIKFGNIMPYSGPASALSVTGKVFSAYFDMINEKGGVNGRKLNMISLDDGFSPPKTVEATRRLVENDGVALDLAAESFVPSPDGLGLFSIRERLKYLGGHLEVEVAPDQWSRLTMLVPLKY